MVRTAKRHAWVAAVLSLLWPRLGHLCVGQPGGFVAAFGVMVSIVVFALFVGFGSFSGLMGMGTVQRHLAILSVAFIAEENEREAAQRQRRLSHESRLDGRTWRIGRPNHGDPRFLACCCLR